MYHMDGLLLVSVSLVLVNGVLSQSDSDCNAMVGHNVTFTSTFIQGGEWMCSSGFSSMYSNGTVMDYDSNNILQDIGTYSIEKSDNINECYATQTWNKGLIECMTFSPSQDLNSTVGCYVFNQPCAQKCNPSTLETGWFATIILNPLSNDVNVSNSSKKVISI